MYPKPLHQIVDEYKERERKGEKTNRYYSPTIKSHIKPFINKYLPFRQLTL